jgi:hypothetical protein
MRDPTSATEIRSEFRQIRRLTDELERRQLRVPARGGVDASELTELASDLQHLEQRRRAIQQKLVRLARVRP